MKTLRMLLAGVALFLPLFLTSYAHAKDDWQQPSKEELEMKDYAGSRGVAAVILYREDNEDDVKAFAEHYYRIKILTEAGKKYADIETPPYVAGAFHISDIRARTIEPDGTVVPFQGKAFDKMIAKARGVKMMAKTWTMPDVRVGSIIEYRYMLRWDTDWVYRTQWQLQEHLPTKSAHFTFKPNPNFHCAWLVMNLARQQQPVDDKNLITMDLQDVPAYETEQYMPPEDEVRGRVEFFYSENRVVSGDEFWKKEGKKWRDTAESFMDKRAAASRQAGTLVAASDTPEQKLHKLYDAVQKMRNLTYERTEKTEADKLKPNANIDDVLKHGYAFHNQLNRAFVAMVRAEGMEATLVKVAERDELMFHKEFPLMSQLTSELAVVQLNGKELYLDPGTLYCPFGILPWEDTGVVGLRAEKDGAKFVVTPQPASTEAVRMRTGKFALDDEGTLTGTLRLTYEGQDALDRRLSAREDDDKQRVKDMEDEVRQWLPSNATVELQSVNGWTSSDMLLITDFKIAVPGFGTSTGRRVLLPASPFRQANPLSRAERTYPVYFHHPYREQDDIVLSLGSRFQVENLPKARSEDRGAAKYNATVSKEEDGIRLKRTVIMDGVLFGANLYPTLRDFYNDVKAGDEDQAILKVVAQ